MSMIKIENAFFSALVHPHGAELKSLKSKKTGREYLWDGNGSWKRSAPVLFPNIGGLADSCYLYDNIAYPALAHGFARDMDFLLVEHTAHFAVFSLVSSALTKKYFPFDFDLIIEYALNEDGISVTWRVKNRDEKIMYFSIGAHPGFRLLPGTDLSEYALYFDKAIAVETRRVEGRYLTEEKEILAECCNVFPLSAKRMEKDAIILEDTGIERLALRSRKHHYDLWIEFPDFPIVAIWTDPHTVDHAAFLCLEPWCGINSFCNDRKEDISRKNRITALGSNELFERSYRIGAAE